MSHILPGHTVFLRLDSDFGASSAVATYSLPYHV